MCWRGREENKLHPDHKLLYALTKSSLLELASLREPPKLIVAVVGNVNCLLDLKISWSRMQKSLRSQHLKQFLRFFNQDTLAVPKKLQQMEERKSKFPNSFKPEVVEKVSHPASVICQWVRAVCERAGMQFDDSTTPVQGSPDCPRCIPLQLPAPPPVSDVAQTMDETLPGWVDLMRSKADKKKLSKKRTIKKTASLTAPESGSPTKTNLATGSLTKTNLATLGSKRAGAMSAGGGATGITRKAGNIVDSSIAKQKPSNKDIEESPTVEGTDTMVESTSSDDYGVMDFSDSTASRGSERPTFTHTSSAKKLAGKQGQWFLK
mmetsp:Transcript_64846/g.119576  ORF Transcript_64846/g.119576 Transcript_64846/m.119576 type:complete len:321 (+) Transcript_64846:2-964(+)